MGKQVILTGIRANNDLTIGNYFGAILPIIDMATQRSDEYQINLFVPDLHSFTTPIDHSMLYDQILHNVRLFVAAGLPLNNPDIHVYRQSHIPAHSELTWILDCFTGMGEMSRMTQYKDKSGLLEIDPVLQEKINTILASPNQTQEDAQALVEYVKLRDSYRVDNFAHKQSVSMGLYNYPVLMAADILLYGASYVPVGEDQSQHLEFTRDIGDRLNSKFGDVFTVPKTVREQHKFFGNDQGLRIKDLQDPTKKMSKSDEFGKGVIFLGDSPEEAAKKIMSAATDSLGKVKFDRENQPGVTNLLQILALLSHKSQAEVNAEWEGKEQYGELKKAVSDATVVFLENLQTKLSQVNDGEILAKLESSEALMNIVANETLLKVQKAVGLRA